MSVSLCSAECSVQFLLELTLHSSCSCGGVFAGALTLPWNPRGLKVVRVYPQLLRVGSKRKFQGVQKKTEGRPGRPGYLASPEGGSPPNSFTFTWSLWHSFCLFSWTPWNFLLGSTSKEMRVRSLGLLGLTPGLTLNSMSMLQETHTLMG